MLSEYEIDLIEKHLEQFDLVINHQYLPNGFSGLVGELDKLMIARGKKAIQRAVHLALLNYLKTFTRCTKITKCRKLMLR